MKKSFLGLGALALLSLSSSAPAALNIYTDITSFNLAAAAGGYSFLGTENWNSGVGTGLITFNDSLTPGVANGPFATGTQVAMG
ncbi:MAG: hypothetical protein WCG75_05870, partial [Armatimonadota bacterium]